LSLAAVLIAVVLGTIAKVMSLSVQDGNGLWAEWASAGSLPTYYSYYIFGAPLVVLVLMWIWLRLIWKSPAPKAQTAVVAGQKRLLAEGDSSFSQIEPYKEPFRDIFDFSFLVGWIVALLAFIACTVLFRPDLVPMQAFWVNLGVKFVAMVLASIVGGLICRACVVVDSRGYTKVDPATSKTLAKVKGFKVNYTRKIQHFAAYAVPIFVSSPVADTPLTLCWGDMATLAGFLITIKPIRESTAFFMMQFNSYDRPEDRPHTLKWIVLGDIVPGMVALVLFYAWIQFGGWSVNGHSATELAFIFIMITGLGDGLAEPVGVHWGTHKYEVGAIMGGGHRKYTRSIEGSCCVAWFSYLFVAMRWYLFANATAFWLTMLFLPPLMAWAEARSPHTMDTPFLFIMGGAFCWLMLFVPPVSFIEP